MSMTEAALTFSLFAAMAAMQLGGSPAVAHDRQADRGGLAAVRAAPLFHSETWAMTTEHVVEGLAAAGALQDPDTEGMIGMGAAVGGPGNF